MADAKRLVDSFWNNSPPVFSIAFQNEHDKKWATAIFDYANQIWSLIESNAESYTWNLVDADRLLALQDRAVNKLLEMFSEVPEDLKDKATFADGRLWHVLNLFTKLPPDEAFEQIVEEMHLIQCGLRSIYECRKRYEENRIGKQIVQLRASDDPRFLKPQNDAWKKLIGNIQAHVGRSSSKTGFKRLYLPHEAKSHQDQAREEVIGKTIAETLSPLYDCSIMESIKRSIKGEFEQLGLWANRNFLDDLDEQNAQMRTPEEGFLSLDDESLNRKSIPVVIDIQSDFEEEFTKNQQDALDEALGSIGRKIFVYRYEHQEIIGRGEGKIIAEALGYSASTVSKYLKHIESQAATIKKIMEM